VPVAVGLTQDQILALLAAYLLAFALPAFLFNRRLARAGEPHRWAWTFLVLVLSVFGMYEYRKHKKIEAKRAQSGPR